MAGREDEAQLIKPHAELDLNGADSAHGYEAKNVARIFETFV
jgi:hypothetical protein